MDFACKRLSGSEKQIIAIKKEISLLSFPDKATIKGQSYLHHFNEVDITTFYGLPSNEHYKEDDILSYYTNALKKNGWNFEKKVKFIT